MLPPQLLIISLSVLVLGSKIVQTSNANNNNDPPFWIEEEVDGKVYIEDGTPTERKVNVLKPQEARPIPQHPPEALPHPPTDKPSARPSPHQHSFPLPLSKRMERRNQRCCSPNAHPAMSPLYLRRKQEFSTPSIFHLLKDFEAPLNRDYHFRDHSYSGFWSSPWDRFPWPFPRLLPKTNPFNSQNLWLNEFGSNRPLNRWMSDSFDDGSLSPRKWVPKTDVVTYKDRNTIIMELPGVKTEDIEIFIKDGTLNVKGNKKQNKLIEHFPNYLELFKTEFHKEFKLQAPINEEDIRAEYTDGILTIHLTKEKTNFL